jgi:chloramphenicol-sensitive protein RarD
VTIERKNGGERRRRLLRSSGHPVTLSEKRKGLAYGVAAYGLWGVMAVYFRAIAAVPPLQVLAHRIVWSAVLLAGLITYFGRWRQVYSCLVEPRPRWLLLASTLFLAVNWYVFLHGVSTEQIVQTSLGYFINPLLNVLIGVVVFRERLGALTWLALLLACGGVAYLIARGGGVPWIAFTVAGSFACYGLIRKVAPVETLLGLSVETFVLTLPSAGVLLWEMGSGRGALGKLGWDVDVLLLLSGVATTGPLFCFGQAARKLPMTTLGFLQYLAPTLQLLTAVLLFGEDFGRTRQVSFGLIWSALALVTLDSLWRARRAVSQPQAPPPHDSGRSDPAPAADVRAASRP